MSVTEKKTRSISTVFNNKSGCTMENGVMRLMGVKDNYHFALESIVSQNDSSDVKCLTKAMFNLNDMFTRANEFGFTEKLGNKLRVKFKDYPNLQISGEANNSFLSFVYEGKEFITAPKIAIKMQKSIGKLVRTFNSVGAYLEKMIAKKLERQRKSAERKAAKHVAAKEAAEVISGATVANDVVMS